MLFLYLIFILILPLAFTLGFFKTYYKKNLVALYLSLLCAPIVSALTLNILFSFLPGRINHFYISIYAAIYTFFYWKFRTEINLARIFIIRATKLIWRKKRKTFSLIATAAIVYFTILAIIALKTPFYENDGLEYAISARQIYKEKTTENYPFIDSEKTNGYYGPWSHPPAYPLLITFDFLLSKDVYSNNFRIISVYFLATLAIFNLLFFRKNSVGLLNFFLMSTTGLLMLKGISGHIELLRIVGFCLPIMNFFFDRTFLRNPKSILINGIISGLALYTHSLSLIAPTLVAVYYLTVGERGWRSKINRAWALIITSSIALIPITPQLIANLKKFRLPVADIGAVPIYKVSSLNYTFYFEYMRGIFSSFDKGVSLFRGFLNFNFFSLSHWLSLFVLFFMWKFKIKFRSKFLEIVVIFYLIVLGFTLLGSNSFIKNDRYIFTIVPLLFFSTSEFFDKLERNQLKKLHYFIIFGIFFNLWYLEKQVNYHLWRYPSVFQHHSNNIERIKDSTIGSHEIINYISRNIPVSTKLLSFRQGDFAYYSPHFVFSHLDHKLLQVFTSSSTEKALALLKEKGIEYLITPYYPEPAIYNSIIEKITSDPRLSEITFQSGGYTLYHIHTRDIKTHLIKYYNIDDKTKFWTSKNDTDFFRLKKGIVKMIRPHYVKKMQQSPETNPITSEADNIFNKSTRRYTRTVLGADSPSTFEQKDYINVDATGEYLVKIYFDGFGQLAPLIYEYASTEIVSREIMSSSIFSPGINHNITGRFIISPNIKRIRVGIQSAFPAKINIRKIELVRIKL
ncbi:hypothetical protein [Bdellovibrio reynosensis]|uniref:Glycosyltransferase RgtA/B/C/D-like domain-containing protein n=1 Tax=Bdellovibrio reynosensis TaxID=2835041 RepID=A0ABY4CBC3_9BACT|nr:hypothetical protein [Bdellovibrio reynosensis]UOF02240.1 hypothetical protein MNR06_04665 [Bdellovibrio reynosensis]